MASTQEEETILDRTRDLRDSTTKVALSNLADLASIKIGDSSNTTGLTMLKEVLKVALQVANMVVIPTKWASKCNLDSPLGKDLPSSLLWVNQEACP